MTKGINHKYTNKHGFFWDYNEDGSGEVTYSPNVREVLCYTFKNEHEERELEEICKSLISNFDFSFRIEGGLKEAREFVSIPFRRRINGLRS